MGMYFESFLAELALASVLFITTLIVYTKYTFQFWTRNNIAQLDPSFPFGDTSSIMLKKEAFGTAFKNIYDKFKLQNKPFGGYYFTYRPELMIVDPDIIKQILVKDFQSFTDRGFYNDEKIEPLLGHLFSIDGKAWKKLRVKLTPTFTSGKMKMMFNTLVACSDELNTILEKNYKSSDPLEIRDICARYTTDVIGSCAFGLDCNSLKNPNTDFRKYGQQFFEPIGLIDKYRGIGAFLFPKIFSYFKLHAMNQDVSNFFLDVVKQTVKYREENDVSRKDFLQLLIHLKNGEKVLTDDETVTLNDDTTNDKKGLTMNQVAAQCFVFFVAGFETSSTTMTFCLYELARNQDIQDKVRKEVNTVLGKHDGKLTYDGMMEMHYVEKVINETLRKFPPLAFLNRKCNKDYPLPKSNHIIRKGDLIRISVLGLQRDPEHFPDPEKFDPERFSKEEEAKRHPYAYMPFGEGPRICIGLRFGMMQTKVGLSVLLKNYKFTLNKKTPDPLVMDPNNFILSSKGGIWLNAQKISEQS